MEISLNEIRDLLLEYLEAGRSIPVENEQERQGNSKLWEKDLYEFLRSKGYEFERHDSKTPDFGDPFNLDVKTLRFDRTTKTFSVAPLTAEQALTGVLPYRMVVLLWKYDSNTGRGHPVDAILVPKEAKSVLTNWSYKGIQVKSGVSERLIREKGLLAGKRLQLPGHRVIRLFTCSNGVACPVFFTCAVNRFTWLSAISTRRRPAASALAAVTCDSVIWGDCPCLPQSADCPLVTDGTQVIPGCGSPRG